MHLEIEEVEIGTSQSEETLMAQIRLVVFIKEASDKPENERCLIPAVGQSLKLAQVLPKDVFCLVG